MREQMDDAGGDDLEHEFWHDEPSGLHRLLSGLRREPSPPRLQRPTISRTRAHRIAPPPVAPTSELPSVAQVAEVTEVAGPRRSIDPLLARIGAMSLVVAFLVPVAVSLRDDAGAPRLTSAPTPMALDTPATLDASTVPPSAAATAATAADDTTTVAPPSTRLDPKSLPPATPVYVEAAPAPEAAGSATATAATHAPTPTAPARASQPACTKSYKVEAGDYWILIAKKVSVSLRELLQVNGATTSTALFPGRSICLPANASPPTTVARPVTTTTAKPVTTTTTAKPVTTTTKPKPPATTAPPPTTAAPKRTYTRAEVELIIRDVWPDHLEEEALRIAWRESNYIPTAKNYCCYGLFQIYFNVHKSWLAGMGVTSATQLFDPVVNAKAAYTLYLRSNGWGPWKL